MKDWTYDGIFIDPEKWVNLYNESQKKIEEETMRSEALLDRVVKEVRNNMDWYSMIIEAAFKEKDNKKKSEKTAWYTLMTHLRDNFFDEENNSLHKDIQFVEVMRCGWESYAYRFVFSYRDNKFSITIPDKNKLTSKNIKYADYGKYEFSIYKSDSYTVVICTSFETEDIKKALKEYINKWAYGCDVIPC